MVTSHQATIEMVTTSNVDIFENQKDLAADSAKKIADVEAKIDKVVADVEEITSYMKKFMVDFQTSSNKNVVEVNKFIEGFGSSLQSEKESPSILCCGLQHDNVDHHMSITNSILRMQTDLAHENKTMDALTESTQKVKVQKEQMKHAMIELHKVNDELLFDKGQNFKINKRFVKIVENKNARYADYTSQMFDAKMKPTLYQLKEVLDVTRSLATMQQKANENDVPVDDKILKVNLRNPYETSKMAKIEVTKVVLEKQTWKQKLKNLTKVKLVGLVIYLLDQEKEK